MFKNLFRGMLRLYIWPLIALLSIFVFSICIGILLPVQWKLLLFDNIGKQFDHIFDQGQTNWLLTLAIFKNNLYVSTLCFITGFLVIVPAIIMISNGVMIGAFLSLLYRTDVIEPGSFLGGVVSLIPHGIFELSAFFISGSLSIMIVVKAIFHKWVEPQTLRRVFLLKSIVRFIVIVIPLLMIAAVIEVYGSNHIGTAVSDVFYRDTYTEQLAVPLNQEFLKTHHCESKPWNTNTNNTQRANLQQSLQLYTKVIYNDEIYSTLLARKGAPWWGVWYVCDNDLMMAVRSWSNTNWSIQDSRLLNERIYQILDTNYIPIHMEDDFVVVRVDGASFNLPSEYTQITGVLYTYNNQTVSLTVSDPAIPVEEIIQLP